jgi:uncharacterized protein (DUF2252 family)
MATRKTASAASEQLLSSFTKASPSYQQRMEQGKLLRKSCPRISHADLALPSRRADPVALLEAQAKSRLPDLIPIRYARMLASPFAFLRGTAAVMARDLAHTPVTGLQVQAGGDMHVANFGLFASAERKLIFGINDFDETLPAAWEWDLKRLATSALVAARHMGADQEVCEQATRSVVKAYREHLHEYAKMGHLQLWNANIDEAALLKALPADLQDGAKAVIAKARSRTNLQVLEKMTDLLDDSAHLVETKPLIVRETHTQSGRPIQEALGLFLSHYMASLAPERRLLLSRYRVLDVARKVVGVGSVGTRCWVIYLQGQDLDDPLFIQVKEAQESVLAPYFGASVYANQGHRVVAGQRLLQGSPDIFLGWGELDGVQYYVRQLRDMKGGVTLEPGKIPSKNIPAYAKLCGWALALAHAKSGDAALLSGYLGNSDTLDQAILSFANTYAEQNERDYQALQKAAASGRIKVASASEAGLLKDA